MKEITKIIIEMKIDHGYEFSDIISENEDLYPIKSIPGLTYQSEESKKLDELMRESGLDEIYLHKMREEFRNKNPELYDSLNTLSEMYPEFLANNLLPDELRSPGVDRLEYD